MAECDGGTDERTVAPSGPLLEVEKEGGAAKETLLAVAKEHRGTPLGTAQSARLEPALIDKSFETPHELDRPRVIKALEDLDQRF